MDPGEQTDSSSPERNAYYFRRRPLNPSLLGHLIAGLLFFALAWYFFNTLASLWGSALSILILGLAVWNLLAVFRQPLAIQMDAENLVIAYPMGSTILPYKRIERLHWARTPTGLGSSARDILKIETKDGRWHKLDYMNGKLKRIRGILERRVYGETL